MVQRTGRILNLNMDDAGALEIATRSRGTPRIANNLVRWVRDFAQMRSGSRIDQTVVAQALEMLAIDPSGLDELDKRSWRLLLITTMEDRWESVLWQWLSERKNLR